MISGRLEKVGLYEGCEKVEDNVRWKAAAKLKFHHALRHQADASLVWISAWQSCQETPLGSADVAGLGPVPASSVTSSYSRPLQVRSAISRHDGCIRLRNKCCACHRLSMASTKVSSLLKRIAEEFGIFSILHSSRDTKLLCLQRFVRLFAYGASTLILVLYLSNLGSSDARIGLFMTLTLLGDVVISFLLTLVADGLGRRRILMLGAILMSASGVVFAMSGNFWVLVAASIFGVISPR